MLDCMSIVIILIVGSSSQVEGIMRGHVGMSRGKASPVWSQSRLVTKESPHWGRFFLLSAPSPGNKRLYFMTFSRGCPRRRVAKPGHTFEKTILHEPEGTLLNPGPSRHTR